MKRAVILLANGFEEIEALSVVDVLRRANVLCDMCSIESKTVSGSHGIKVEGDILFDDAHFDGYDLLILPGGMPGSANLRDNDKVIELVKRFDKEGRLIAAICAAPMVLSKAGVIDKKEVTSYPGALDKLGNCTYMEELTWEDGNIITSRGPATSIYFAFHILRRLGLLDKAEELKKGMLVQFVEDMIKGR